MRPPFNLELVEAATAEVLKSGHRIFQTHQYGKTDKEHVEFLLACMAPRQGALILDNGCGVGEVARLMHRRRPDLRFILANISPLQLSHCPNDFQHLLTDSHALDLPDQSVDIVMFACSLCQMDADIALREAHRVLVPGGWLFINEPVRMRGDGREFLTVLAGHTPTLDQMFSTVEAAGFLCTSYIRPGGSSEVFRQMLAPAGFGHLANDIEPIVLRASKREVRNVSAFA